jgi:hypothetical protein
MQAVLEDDDVLVTFDWPGEGDRLGMRFPLAEAPVGPSTGEVCDTPAQWAAEVGFVLMEELETGLTRRAPRSVRADSVVELHYRPAPG